jgi:tRNA (guanosine-2'-O-)-methyltransferase
MPMSRQGVSVCRILIAMQQRRIERITTVVDNRQAGVIVVLEDIHDPHNAAAILRTCEAMGIQRVWFVFEKETPYNPKRIGKATSSSANKWLDFQTFSSSMACIEALKKEKHRIVVSALSDTAVSLERYHDPKSPIALVVGNEHAGVSEMMMKEADIVVKIPMRGFVQSLNVSVAAAILLWEITKQRMFSDTPPKLSPKAQQALLNDFLERAKK